MKSSRYLYIVILVISFECINYCQCSTSAKTQENNTRSDTQYYVGTARLIGGIESITPVSNAIGEPPKPVYKDPLTTKPNYQYFNNPLMITTPKYDTKSVAYYSKMEPENHRLYSQTPHVTNNNYMVPRPSPTPMHIVRVTQAEPVVWQNDLMKMDNQYFDTFRSIKTSVLGFITKMQHFDNYVVEFFAEEGE